MSNLSARVTRKALPISILLIVLSLMALLTLTSASAASDSRGRRHPRQRFAPQFTVTFNVNSTDDAVDADGANPDCDTTTNHQHVCTLRAAVMQANYNCQQVFAGTAAVIVLQDATYQLTLSDNGSSDASSGDLDMFCPTTMVGLGHTTIDASTLNDRALSVRQGTQTVTLKHIKVAGGHSSFGGGILVANAKLKLIHSIITGNFADEGAGIFNFGTLILKKSVVSNNLPLTGHINSGGGGIISENTLIMDRSTVSGNQTHGPGGGLFFVAGTITNSTISGNQADYGGGGIDFLSGTATLLNSTVSGNTSASSGGGIAVGDGGTLNLGNVTVAYNRVNRDTSDTTETGAGVNVNSGTLNFKNTLLSNNSTTTPDPNFPPLRQFHPDDCLGTLHSLDYNLIQSPSAACTIQGTTAHNQIGKDPMLGQLAHNGGPTQTHALPAGSPAIDRGHPGVPTTSTPNTGCTDYNGAALKTDQRGKPRFVDGDGNGIARCDIGAYEYQP